MRELILVGLVTLVPVGVLVWALISMARERRRYREDDQPNAWMSEHGLY